MNIDLKILLFSVMFVPIFTLTHEFGHYVAARIIGYDSQIHYNKTSSTGSTSKELLLITKENQERDKTQTLSSSDDNVDFLTKKFIKEKTIIVSGGLLITYMLGFIGLYFLRKNRDSLVSLFLSLFTLRSFVVLLHFAFNKNKSNVTYDEFRLSELLFAKAWVMPTLLGFISFLLGLYIYKNFIQNKKVFILNSLLGCGLGILLWFILLGPILLP